MTTKYVVHFHDGTMEGDCSELRITMTTKPASFEEAFEAALSFEGMGENWDWSDDVEDFIECHENDFTGAWVLTEAKSKRIDSIPFPEAGGDSVCYAQQAMKKALYQLDAVATLGPKPIPTSTLLIQCKYRD